MAKKRISVCIITKNEEKNIRRCLECLKPYPFDIVVIDTGSTDNTKQVAQELADRVYDFAWINDFSAARNFAASKARCDWILAIDSDEFLEHLDLDELYRHMDAYPSSVGSIIQRNQIRPDDTTQTYRARVARLYNKYYYAFTGSIHEQLNPFTGDEHSLFHTSLSVYHIGYALPEEENRQKDIRNRDLLLKAIEADPENPYNYLQLAKTYDNLDENDLALSYYQKGFSFDIDPERGYMNYMIVNYGKFLLRTNRFEEALGFESFYDTFCNTADFVYLMGQIYSANNLPLKALLQFIKATTMTEYSQDGVNSYLAYYRIGLIYAGIGNTELAVTFLKKCGDWEPALQKIEELEG